MKQKKFTKYTSTMKQVLKTGTRWIYQYISDYEIYVSNGYVLCKMTKDEFEKYCDYKKAKEFIYEPESGECYECYPRSGNGFVLSSMNLKEMFERFVNNDKDYTYHIPTKLIFEHHVNNTDEIGYVSTIYNSDSNSVIEVNAAFLDSIGGDGMTYVRGSIDPIIVSYLADITAQIIPYAVLLPIRPDEKEAETVKFYCKYQHKETNNNG